MSSLFSLYHSFPCGERSRPGFTIGTCTSVSSHASAGQVSRTYARDCEVQESGLMPQGSKGVAEFKTCVWNYTKCTTCSNSVLPKTFILSEPVLSFSGTHLGQYSIPTFDTRTRNLSNNPQHARPLQKLSRDTSTHNVRQSGWPHAARHRGGRPAVCGHARAQHGIHSGVLKLMNTRDRKRGGCSLRLQRTPHPQNAGRRTREAP